MHRSGFSHDEALPLAALCLCIFLIFDFFKIKFISIPFGALCLVFCIIHIFFFRIPMYFLMRRIQSGVNDCLFFLRSNQPLPSAELISKETLNKLDNILEFLKGRHIEESIPLLLNCFGEGDGHGVYLKVEEVIVQHSKETVLPHLLQAFSNRKGSVRYWCAQIARRFPDPSLLDPLRALILSGNVSERAAAILAVESFNTPEAAELLQEVDQQER